MVAKWIVQIMDCVCVHAGSLSSSRQDHKFHLFPAVGKQNVGGKRRKKKSITNYSEPVSTIQGP